MLYKNLSMRMSNALTADVIAIIPARYASSRFPGKPLAKILGVPLVLRVVERVAAVLPMSQVYVATDDERIHAVCATQGVRVLMTSRHCLTGTDRTWEAAKQVEAEIILNVQGDEPLVHAEDIRTVISAKRAHPTSVVNAMCPISRPEDIASPHVPKVVVNVHNDLVYMSRAPIPFVRGNHSQPVYRRQVCIYGFHLSELRKFAEYGRKSPLEEPEDIEILRFVDLQVPVHMVTVSAASVAVDIPEDIARVEQLFARHV